MKTRSQWPYLTSFALHVTVVLAVILFGQIPATENSLSEAIEVDLTQPLVPVGSQDARVQARNKSELRANPANAAKTPPPPSPAPQVDDVSLATEVSTANAQAGATFGDADGSLTEATVAALEDRIRQKLNSKKSYPRIALRLGQQGTVVVRFRLHRDGRVEQIELVDPTPFPSLNSAAKELLQKIDGEIAFPPDYRAEFRDFTVPIQYRL